MKTCELPDELEEKGGGAEWEGHKVEILFLNTRSCNVRIYCLFWQHLPRVKSLKFIFSPRTDLFSHQTHIGAGVLVCGRDCREVRQTKVYCQSPGDHKSPIRVPAGLVPSEGCCGRTCFRPFSCHAHGCLSPRSLFVFGFVLFYLSYCVFIFKLQFLKNKNTSHIGLGIC